MLYYDIIIDEIIHKLLESAFLTVNKPDYFLKNQEVHNIMSQDRLPRFMSSNPAQPKSKIVHLAYRIYNNLPKNIFEQDNTASFKIESYDVLKRPVIQ